MRDPSLPGPLDVGAQESQSPCPVYKFHGCSLKETRDAGIDVGRVLRREAADYSQPGQRVEARGREFDAPDLGGSDDIAGHANHKQISQTLVEHELRRDPRVRAAQDDGEGLLGLARDGIGSSGVGDESEVPLTQPR